MQQNNLGNHTIITAAPYKAETAIGPVPRTNGTLMLSTKRVDTKSGIDRFRTSGAMKALFARAQDVQAILINTSGGLTGGDRLDIAAHAGAGSEMTLTTQAAERAYRSQEGEAQVTTALTIDAGARLNWLPQEMILFDGAALHRSLDVNIHGDGRLLMVEPLIFGRVAMGEVLNDVRLKDRVNIRRDDAPLYRDSITLDGNTKSHMARLAIGHGAGAMASLVYVAPDAEAHMEPIRATLPKTGGVSLIQSDCLVMRLLATDSFELRRALLPILDRLSQDRLPTSWRL